MGSSNSGSMFFQVPPTNGLVSGSMDEERIVSLLGDDPDLGDLVHDFVAAMPERIAAIRAAIHSQDLSAVQRLLHQLKGACGSYGFPQLTYEAGQYEKMLHKGMSFSDIEKLLEPFIRKLSLVSAR